MKVRPVFIGEPLAKRRGFAVCQGLPSVGATTTTAASGGNRESLLGPRPAGCEARTKGRSRCWEPQPGQWHAVGVTKRFNSYGKALLRPTSQSPSVTAPLVGEPLAKRAGFRVTAKLPMSERRKKAPLELPLLGGISFGEAIRSSAPPQSSTRAAASSFVRRLRTAKYAGMRKKQAKNHATGLAMQAAK